jgi:hypothetical protein
MVNKKISGANSPVLLFPLIPLISGQASPIYCFLNPTFQTIELSSSPCKKTSNHLGSGGNSYIELYIQCASAWNKGLVNFIVIAYELASKQSIKRWL